MSEPTPRPWRTAQRFICPVDPETGEPSLDQVIASTHRDILPGTDLANAEHIVRCVNAHEKLVEALQRLRDEVFVNMAIESNTDIWQQVDDALRLAGAIK